MKNYIIFLISFFPLFFYAQSGTTIYKKDDFQYKEIKILDKKNLDGSYPNSFTEDFHNSTPTTNRSSPGIGETPGHLSVSLTGAAQYDIPIAVPSGSNGIAPEISLSYNSQVGNGIAGYGWNINGISSITRIPSTKFHDNEINEVNFNSFDRFALDGQRLILKTGIYGANGAEYETEKFSNLKIVSYGTSSFGSSYGPAYFVVHYPDGSIAHFGNSNDSRTELDYGITYWQNPQGIRISYEYSTSYNTLSIKKIKYGNLYTSSTFNEIEFTYSTIHNGRWEQIYVNQSNVVRSNILEKITSYSNGTRYRQYIIDHDETDLKYKRVISVVEESGNGASQHSMISFNYTDTSESIIGYDITTDLGLVNIEQRNAKMVAFDFSGKGDMDFIVYPLTKDKFWIFPDLEDDQTNVPISVNSGDFESIFPTTIVNSNGIVLQGQGFTVVQKNSTQAQFKVFAKGYTLPVYLQYTKLWDIPTYTYTNESDCTDETRQKPFKYVSGDFNGDGLTDVLAIGESYQTNDCLYVVSCNCTSVQNNANEVRFIDLNQNVASNFANYAGVLTQHIEEGDIVKTGDFNGDGKTDLIVIKDGSFYVYSLDSNNMLSILWYGFNSEFYDTTLPYLLGDFNGDGKTDMMSPTANNSNLFRIFASEGSDFSIATKTQPFEYKRTNFNGSNGVLTGYNLIPLDVNGDGRTDIIDYKTTTYNNHDNGNQQIRVYNNEGLDSQVHAVFTEFKFSSYKSVTGNLKHFPIPIFTPSSQPNKGLDFASISNKWVRQFSFTQDHREDVLIRSITNNGVTYNIDYSNLNPEETINTYPFVYVPSNNSKTYPYKNINYAPGIKLVKMLERVSIGTPTVQQHYRYNGAVFNFEGLGFSGFEGVAMSNWHTDNSNRIYDVKLFDPMLRGAQVATYSNANYMQFSFIPSSGYITKTTFSNSSSLSPSKVFKLWVDSSSHQNALTSTYINTNYTYDNYLNPIQVYTNHSGDGTSLLVKNYSHNTGSNYYIGRLINETQTTTIGGNSFSKETQYHYSGHLVYEKKIKGNNTPFDIESFSYDSFGNVIQKVIRPNGESPRVINFEYDDTGRFIKKIMDVNGLISIYETDNSSGMLISETNPYGLITTFEYDEWDRLIRTKDYLGNSTTTSYVENQNIYTVTNLSDDGSSSVFTYDALKRLSKIEEKDVLGQWVGKSFLYDAFDRLQKESEPYIGTGPTQWNRTEYDLYSRPISQNLYNGRTINITYEGLNKIINDGVKTITSSSDALGNTLSVNDPGGIINYSYFGNGNLRSVNYGGNIIRIEQDGWGRKTKMVDPSAGVYEYSYNGFGELTRERTPKGETDYFYSTTGTLIKKNTVGDNTEVLINYGYNENNLLTTISLTDEGNNSNYFYSYDNYSRLKETSEITEFANFKNEYSYDEFGRIHIEKYQAKLYENGKYSKKEIKNNYQNGRLKNIKDLITNDVIWEIDEINARSQIVSASMGTKVYEKNEYDSYGFLTNKLVVNNDEETLNILMELTSDFDVQRGTLNSRTNSAFSWSESFSYDDLDRLLTFNDNNGENSITYDNLGRIQISNDVGEYDYSESSYQVSKIELNNQGDLFYQQRQLQQVKFNAFKKPYEINDNESEKIGFSYNAFQGRSNMFYGDSSNDILERNNRKHYSSNGSMEISYDRQTDNTLFVFYIGGDAYTAPAIWRSEQKEGADDIESDYYLHRDYLGSILMISDVDGNIKEKRHFDAWGNIVKLEDGDNNTLDKLTFLDRGYTGHEHLQGVKLIHMNGRLYDPKLKRFLSPDNYIQNIANSQNFNRYSYVLNNPLMYIDPSGETYSDTGGSESNNNFEQTLIGGLISSAFAVDWGSVTDWFDTNWDSAVGDIGGFLGNAIKEFYSLFGFNFGSSTEYAITTYTNPINLHNDPLTGSSSATDISHFSGGGSNSGSLGISGWVLQQGFRGHMFASGFRDGFVGGGKSTWDFVKSLGTSQGWKDLGQGFVNLAHMGSLYPTAEGTLLNMQMSESISSYIENIPSMSAYEIGYDVGYGTEKVGETIIGSKGVGALGNLRHVNKVKFINTTTNGTRVFGIDKGIMYLRRTNSKTNFGQTYTRSIKYWSKTGGKKSMGGWEHWIDW